MPLTTAPTFFPAKIHPEAAASTPPRVIHSFGGKTLAIFPAGGDRGARFEHYMHDCGFPVATVPIRNKIRLNFTITDRHGLTVKLNELGPRLERGEVRASKKPSKRNSPTPPG